MSTLYAHNAQQPDTPPAPLMASDATLRDFFIAHAPAEPQPWFKPVMSTERPTEPMFPEGGTAEQRSYVREFLDVMSPDEAGTPALREYIVAYRSGRDAARQWDAEAKKQRYIQWPAAWADAMLAARSKP